MPPGERLEPGHLPGGDRNLGLVIEDDLAALERPSEFAAQQESPGIVGVVLGAIDGIGTSRALRRVHRHVGALKQRFGRRAMVGTNRDPDTGRHLEGMLLAEEWAL